MNEHKLLTPGCGNAISINLYGKNFNLHEIHLLLKMIECLVFLATYKTAVNIDSVYGIQRRRIRLKANSFKIMYYNYFKNYDLVKNRIRIREIETQIDEAKHSIMDSITQFYTICDDIDLESLTIDENHVNFNDDDKFAKIRLYTEYDELNIEKMLDTMKSSIVNTFYKSVPRRYLFDKYFDCEIFLKFIENKFSSNYIKIISIQTGSLDIVIDILSLLSIFGLQNYSFLKDIIGYMLMILQKWSNKNTNQNTNTKQILLPELPIEYKEILSQFDDIEMNIETNRIQIKCRKIYD